ncbi:hypothetical protein, partial [Salmonella sp. s54412]|uniref:hypothetical protein n=1 Tax=Salmonella sp. s54412 TaxID=3160128 RepID=UPI0037546891
MVQMEIMVIMELMGQIVLNRARLEGKEIRVCKVLQVSMVHLDYLGQVDLRERKEAREIPDLMAEKVKAAYWVPKATKVLMAARVTKD